MKIDHTQYFHEIMKETKEYKDKPWMWYQVTYYVLESKDTKHTLDKEWMIINYFNDRDEAEKYIRWLEREYHEPMYEMVIDKYRDSKERLFWFTHGWSIKI